jgi:hypothetical protein
MGESAGGYSSSILSGDPPNFGVTEFENIDKAQAWLKSSGREAIAPKRDKAIKLVRQFIFEGK